VGHPSRKETDDLYCENATKLELVINLRTAKALGLARGLGVTTDVTGPTFVLVNQYRGRLPVYHLDAYRTGSLTELVDLGLEEMLQGDGVTMVEWADKPLPLLPARTIHVHLSGLGDEPGAEPADRPPTLGGS
jgi:tRNA threonylcarbamoyl adenosine modification protein YjeE